jgi:hypothetical protein
VITDASWVSITKSLTWQSGVSEWAAVVRSVELNVVRTQV